MAKDFHETKSHDHLSTLIFLDLAEAFDITDPSVFLNHSLLLAYMLTQCHPLVFLLPPWQLILSLL